MERRDPIIIGVLDKGIDGSMQKDTKDFLLVCEGEVIPVGFLALRQIYEWQKFTQANIPFLAEPAKARVLKALAHLNATSLDKVIATCEPSVRKNAVFLVDSEGGNIAGQEAITKVASFADNSGGTIDVLIGSTAQSAAAEILATTTHDHRYALQSSRLMWHTGGESDLTSMAQHARLTRKEWESMTRFMLANVTDEKRGEMEQLLHLAADDPRHTLQLSGTQAAAFGIIGTTYKRVDELVDAFVELTGIDTSLSNFSTDSIDRFFILSEINAKIGPKARAIVDENARVNIEFDRDMSAEEKERLKKDASIILKSFTE